MLKKISYLLLILCLFLALSGCTDEGKALPEETPETDNAPTITAFGELDKQDEPPPEISEPKPQEKETSKEQPKPKKTTTTTPVKQTEKVDKLEEPPAETEPPQEEAPVEETDPPAEEPVEEEPPPEDPAVGMGSFIWPVTGRNVITPYGSNESGAGFHMGIDIEASEGTPVFAAETGTVSMAKSAAGYGNFVSIDHGNGKSTLYAHLAAFSVTVNDVVQKGTQIATSGKSGTSSPHLHFEIIEKGSRIDPQIYLP